MRTAPGGRPFYYMAIQVFSGFDSQSQLEATNWSASVPHDTTVTHMGAGASVRFDRADDGSNGRFVRLKQPSQADAAITNAYATFYFYLETLPVSANMTVFSIRSSSANPIILVLDSSGRLAVTKSNYASRLGLTDAIPMNQWLRIDLRVVRSTSGAWELKIDGESVLSGTSDFGSSGTYGYVQLESNSETGSAPSDYCWRIDDVFLDDSGYTPCEQAVLLLPDGNGNYTGFTNDYTAVDEAPPYSTSDYIEATTNQAETVTVASIPAGSIPHCVSALHASARTSGTGTSTLAGRIRSNGTDSDGPNATLTATTVLRGWIRNTDPSGGGAWTESRVNAVEVGVVLTGSGTRTVRTYWIAAQVALEFPKIQPTGIASEEAFGTATLVYPQALSPAGIGTEEAFGSSLVAPGALSVLPAGISPEEAFGTAVVSIVNPAQTLEPGGIASEEAFGAVTLALGAVLVQPAGIGTEEAFGAVLVALGAVTLQPGGISPEEAFGAVTVAPGAVTVAPAGVGTEEAFGATLIQQGGLVLIPDGISSLEAFGAVVVAPGGVTLEVAGISSLEAFGTAELFHAILLVPTGIASAEAFGAALLSAGAVQILPAGIDSLEAFGAATLAAGAAFVIPPGIASGEAFGAATAQPGAITVEMAGIGSAEAFGAGAVIPRTTVEPAAVGSGEAFGAAELVAGAVPLQPVGILSGETFGVSAVMPGAVVLIPEGISPEEAFGAAVLALVFVQPNFFLALDGRLMRDSLDRERRMLWGPAVRLEIWAVDPATGFVGIKYLDAGWQIWRDESVEAGAAERWRLEVSGDDLTEAEASQAAAVLVHRADGMMWAGRIGDFRRPREVGRLWVGTLSFLGGPLTPLYAAPAATAPAGFVAAMGGGLTSRQLSRERRTIWGAGVTLRAWRLDPVDGLVADGSPIYEGWSCYRITPAGGYGEEWRLEVVASLFGSVSRSAMLRLTAADGSIKFWGRIDRAVQPKLVSGLYQFRLQTV